MGNKHEKRFLINILIGLLFTTGGILSIIYIIFTKAHENDAIFWAAIPVVTINTGLLFIGSAIVHKVKADFIRRQKRKSRPDEDED